ncbi:Bifunctional chorismate mutase/prephenate dehydratase [Beauveria bassiana]|uniref:prephenate dehydratase n=1 Tax=Beauveria bassiana (strain ARSEF 2860) TaxID=655819 RepID=J4VT94_BEAB2|nr:prephenate dehydratase [Beauveria bassiana ARSEF 2860]EJP61765.1 prephenate dehydratase [Beauveria bassiana ARSEF 2860]KAH8716721.1 Bifunctional chorismate mutase/prephenate dehydratase [Beauveria bassiana]
MSLTCAGIGSPIVAYLGPIASYSQQAALQAFGEDVWQLKPVDTIQDIFVEVQSQCATWGVVPLENSANGAVDLTLNGLADYNRSYVNIQVGGDTYVPVNHYLLGHDSPTVPSATSQSSKAQELPIDSFQHIQKVYSHPQALGQCSKFLDKYLKNAQRLEVSSTSKAAAIVSNDTTGKVAAISSELASKAFKLDVLAKSIQDQDDNTTRFLIISRNDTLPAKSPTQFNADCQCSGGRKTYKGFLSFTVSRESSRALTQGLSAFADSDISIIGIHSRPGRVLPFQYIYLVEFEVRNSGNGDRRIGALMERIGSVTQDHRWLGGWQACHESTGDSH